MVFRERHEKVAFVEVLTEVIGRLYNLNIEKAFGHIVGNYAGEVFQETYDATLLKQKMAAIRLAQARVRMTRKTQIGHLTKLDRLGEYYDRKLGPDLIPKGTVPGEAGIMPTSTRGPRKGSG